MFIVCLGATVCSQKMFLFWKIIQSTSIFFVEDSGNPVDVARTGWLCSSSDWKNCWKNLEGKLLFSTMRRWERRRSSALMADERNEWKKICTHWHVGWMFPRLSEQLKRRSIWRKMDEVLVLSALIAATAQRGKFNPKLVGNFKSQRPVSRTLLT